MTKRIVVPLDGSKTAEMALPHAVALARAAGYAITLLRVVPPPVVVNSTAWTVAPAVNVWEEWEEEVNAEGDYLAPDIVFIRKARMNELSDRGVESPPDLVVEVLSPSTEHRDRGVKLERYRHFGVAAYWIVDPEASTIEVWDLANGAEAAVVFGAADTLRWQPASDATTVAIPLGEVFGTEKL